VGTGRESGEIVHGLRASLAVLEARPKDILRVASSAERRRDVGALITYAERQQLPWSEMDERSLSRLAESEHHEGVCIFVKPRVWTTPSALTELLVSTRGCALALDRVRNPYNTGAILRTAAFFGLPAVILGAQAPHPALAPQAVRVAEGGAEHLRLTRTTDLGDTLQRMRTRGVRVLGADGGLKEDARKQDLRGPLVIVMGNEREGLLPRVREQCDGFVSLVGTGKVESLNVSIAASLLIQLALYPAR
jgi:tRNA G18 (ribose-2'-O)-methylase SpoU